MDVRIGIIQTVKELDIDLPEGTTHDDVVAEVDKALAQPDGVLWLVDKRGRRWRCHRPRSPTSRSAAVARTGASASGPPDALSSVPELLAHQLLFVTGKGGVGKTTVAAAIALLASEQGRRTLVCEVEPKGDLARAYECGPTPFSGRRVSDDLVAMSMDTEAALREYLRAVAKVPTIGRIGPVARAFDFVATAAPGIREILTVGKLCFEVREGPLRPRGGRRLLDRQRRRPAGRTDRHQRADPRRRRAQPDRLDTRDPRRPGPDRGGARHDTGGDAGDRSGRPCRRVCRPRRRSISPAWSRTGSCPSSSAIPRSRSSTSSPAPQGSI